MSEIIQKLHEKFQGKKVLIVGLGLQGGGVGMARFFAELGAHVTVTDKKSESELHDSIEQLQEFHITYRIGKHELDDFLKADVIFKGPSVRWDMPEIKEAQNKGVPVEMEASFFAAYCPCKIIGVTGTRGKSTTSHMIYELLRANGVSTHIAGNIPGQSTISLLHILQPSDIVVLELSSWALSGFHQRKISPDIAVFTNFYPDHLNYYSDMDAYFHDKAGIFMYQESDDYLIANKILETKIQKKPHSTTIYFEAADFPGKLQHLKGSHNYENAAAAYKVSQILELNEEVSAKSIATFPGVAYRQQIVGQKGTVIFINDTTSTTPTATIKAIETFTDHPIVLILGGNAKGLPHDELIDKLDQVNQIILLSGSFTDEVLPVLKEKYADKLSPLYSTIDEAIVQAYQKAQAISQTSYVLFSPGATSFAMFRNEFHRGDEFNRIVKSL